MNKGLETWRLCDVEDRQRLAPSFELPPVLSRWNLRSGQIVKLIFERNPPVPCPVEERLWVEVVAEVMPGRYRGRLQSKPTAISGLRKGVEVIFGPHHVVFIIEEDT